MRLTLFGLVVSQLAQSASIPIIEVHYGLDCMSVPHIIAFGPNQEAIGTASVYAVSRCKPFRYQADVTNNGDDAFIVGGVNSSERLRRIKTITGATFETLEGRMVGSGNRNTGRATMMWMFNEGTQGVWSQVSDPLTRKSGPGFILKNQKLRQLLIADNDTVLSQNLTHQKVADPLLQILEKVESQPNLSVTVEIDGVKYEVKAVPMNTDIRLISGWVGEGTQGSNFNDDLFATYVLKIKRPDGTVLRIDALTPHLIHRYGFYQGGPFRVAPETIIKFFGLRRP